RSHDRTLCLPVLSENDLCGTFLWNVLRQEIRARVRSILELGREGDPELKDPGPSWQRFPGLPDPPPSPHPLNAPPRQNPCPSRPVVSAKRMPPSSITVTVAMPECGCQR